MITKKHLSASIDGALLDELEKLHPNKSAGVEAAIRAYLKEQKAEIKKQLQGC